MDLATYLTTPAPGLDPLGWVLFIAQIVTAIMGVYFAFLRGDSHPIRGPALRRLGYTLLVLGGLGTLVGALRLAAVEPFTAPFWLLIVVAFELVLAVYALYYARAIYPPLKAEYERVSRSSGRRSSTRTPPALQTNGHAASASPTIDSERAVIAGGRRESRRDRKRRGR